MILKPADLKVQPSMILKVINDLPYRIRCDNLNSISIVLTFDMECLKSDKLRYLMLQHTILIQYNIDKSSISTWKRGTSILTQFNIKEILISKIRTSISLYPDIENLSISTNAPLISVYDIEACASISSFVFFNIGVSL